MSVHNGKFLLHIDISFEGFIKEKKVKIWRLMTLSKNWETKKNTLIFIYLSSSFIIEKEHSLK